MDTRYLKFFVAVCRAGCISRAAGDLFISQQGLSSALARLEGELGRKLLRRTSQGVAPTADGEILLSRAERILELVGECEDAFASSAKVRTIRVGCAYGVVGVYLERALAAFGETHPGVTVKVTEYPDLLCEEAVEKGEVDVGFTVGPLSRRKFDALFILKHAIRAIVHRSHPLAKRKRLSIDDLRRQPVVVMNGSFRIHHNLLARARAAGFVPDIVTEAAEVALVHKLVEKGKGIGLTVDFIVQDIPKPGVVDVAMADSTFVWDIHMITRKRPRPDEDALRLVRFVTEAQARS